MADENFKWLTQKEVEAFFKAVRKHGNDRDLAMFGVMYWFGLRVSEVGLLQLEDYREDAKDLYVRRVKKSISRSYQLTDELDKQLRKYLKGRSDKSTALFASRKGGGVGRQQVYDLFRKFAELAKLPKGKRHCHTMRHAIAVHMVDAGFEIIKVAHRLGHRNIQNTMVYANVSGQAAADIHDEMLLSDRVVKL